MAFDLDETEDRLLLRALVEVNRDLELYSAHESLRLTPGQIVSATNKLVALGIAQTDGTRLSLSPPGEAFCVRNASRIWSDRWNKPWKAIPEFIGSDNAGPPVLYCPWWQSMGKN